MPQVNIPPSFLIRTAPKISYLWNLHGQIDKWRKQCIKANRSVVPSGNLGHGDGMRRVLLVMLIVSVTSCKAESAFRRLSENIDKTEKENEKLMASLDYFREEIKTLQTDIAKTDIDPQDKASKEQALEQTKQYYHSLLVGAAENEKKVDRWKELNDDPEWTTWGGAGEVVAYSRPLGNISIFSAVNLFPSRVPEFKDRFHGVEETQGLSDWFMYAMRYQCFFQIGVSNSGDPILGERATEYKNSSFIVGGGIAFDPYVSMSVGYDFVEESWRHHLHPGFYAAVGLDARILSSLFQGTGK